MGVLISIDNGGTLTDACAVRDGALFHAKALTTPFDLTKCFLDVLGKLSTEVYGEENLHRLLAETDYIRYSTTQGTNAVVERKGPRLGLILAKGMKPSRFTGSPEQKDLFEAVIGDRIAYCNPALSDQKLDLEVTKAVNQLVQAGAARLVISLGGDDLAARELRVRKVLNHRFPRHLLGAVPYLLSSELSDSGDDWRRTWSAILNSFLHPSIDAFLYGAEAALKDRNLHRPLLIYRNDGNSTRVAKTVALKTYGSGPRGGVAGVEAFAAHYGYGDAVMMDIGGTSTDIAHIGKSAGQEAINGMVEGIPVVFPMMGVHSLGAGGGSVMRVAKGKVTVGPDSVGAVPGPASFGQGGQEATVTDAYLVTGTFDAASYLRGTLHLDIDRARAAIKRNVADPLGLTVEQGAFAIIDAYKEKIAAGIRDALDGKRAKVLVAFGGGGPISACGVADRAGFDTVLVPRMAAVFSAFGIGFSDIAHLHEAVIQPTQAALAAALPLLRERAERDMFSEGFDLADCEIAYSLLLVDGETGRSVPLAQKPRLPKAAGDAAEVRLRVHVTRPIPKFALKPVGQTKAKKAVTKLSRSLLLPDGSRVDAPLYRMDSLRDGHSGSGPALIEDDYFTFRVPDGWSFRTNANGDIVASKNKGS
jgi:N-methylhydantoinase A